MQPLRATVLALAGLLLPLSAAAQQPAGVPSAAADSLLSVAAQSRVRGADDAPVTIVELSDFQCPFCRRFAQTTYAELDSAYIRTGKVKLVFLNLPLPMHGQAWTAAEAGMCAGAQGKFWPMHDRLFAAQEEWSGAEDAAERFSAYAREIGLDASAFDACVAGDRMAPLILGDVIQAARSGAGATPTFVINGETVLSGARPFTDFQQAIEKILAK